jgi:phospholipid/cholesterol/gamma-HCH transport system substrate-binding protein
MERRLIDFWVGIFVALGIAATAFISLNVANLTTSTSGPTYELIAEFENIGNLKVKAPVKNSGVIIGRVKEIYLDTNKQMAAAKLEIEHSYQFSIDASASIFTSGLLGEQYVSIEEGYEEEKLKPGDTLFITSSAMVLEKLISEYMFSKASEGVE